MAPSAAAIIETDRTFPFRLSWRPRKAPRFHFQYSLEVITLLGLVTAVGWLLPIDYHPLGHLYLLAVIVISLRTPLRYAVSAALLSAMAWNYIFIPPKMSFAVIDFDASLLLGTYLFSAVIGSQLMARLQAERRQQAVREQQALTLLRLSEALGQAHTLEETVRTSVTITDSLFGGRSAIFVLDGECLRLHPSSSFCPNEKTCAELFSEHGTTRIPYTYERCVFIHLNSTGEACGVLVIESASLSVAFHTIDQALMQGVAGQIALSLEREHVRRRNQREALFVESEKMHRVLLNSVSHELKTPLSILRTASEKLSGASESRKEVLHKEIHVAMTRLDRLVANLLTQSRIQAGRLDAELDWCDLRDIIFAVRRSVEPSLTAHTLNVQIPDEFPLLFADSRLFEEAVYNLVNNAVRYTPVGSTITVDAWESESGERIGVLVRDNGPGLEADYAREIFLPFRRGKAAVAGGVGLGLSIVHGLITAQNGGAEYTEAPEGGAIFKLWIPRKSVESLPLDES